MLVFPDVMEHTHDINECRLLSMSRMISVVMLMVYGAYLFFQVQPEHKPRSFCRFSRCCRTRDERSGSLSG